MAVTTGTLTTARQGDLALALEMCAKYIREADVGGTSRALAITIALDTAGTATFTVPARGGNPAYVAAVTAAVA